MVKALVVKLCSGLRTFLFAIKIQTRRNLNREREERAATILTIFPSVLAFGPLVANQSKTKCNCILVSKSVPLHHLTTKLTLNARVPFLFQDALTKPLRLILQAKLMSGTPLSLSFRSDTLLRGGDASAV